MKFYENLPLDERQILSCEVAAFSTGMEGIQTAAKDLLQQAKEIREKRSELTEVLNPPSNPEER